MALATTKIKMAMIMYLLHSEICGVLFVALVTALASLGNADYSMNIQLSSERVNEGGNVTVTCDVIGQQTNSLLSVVWAKRTIDGEQFEIGTERNMTERFQKTQRYAARRQLMDDPKHIKFSLTISGRWYRPIY